MWTCITLSSALSTYAARHGVLTAGQPDTSVAVSAPERQAPKSPDSDAALISGEKKGECTYWHCT